MYYSFALRGMIYGNLPSQIVPFKKRCGVTSLSDISPENRCYCTEKMDNGVGEGASNVPANSSVNLSFFSKISPFGRWES